MLITSPVKFDYGDTVDFSGFVREIDGKMNENGFDLKRDYKSKGIFYRCFSASPVKSDTEIKSYSVYSYAQTLKNSISQILDKYVHGDKGLLLKAIIVGEPVKFSDEFGAVLTRTGTTRFFYPAFLHVMLIIGTVGARCTACFVRDGAKLASGICQMLSCRGVYRDIPKASRIYMVSRCARRRRTRGRHIKSAYAV